MPALSPLTSISGSDTPVLGRLASNLGPEKSPFGPVILTSPFKMSALGPLRSIPGPEPPTFGRLVFNSGPEKSA